MFIREDKIDEVYYRYSKSMLKHKYTRTRTDVLFICDNCGSNFTRPKGEVSPKRLSNNYFHCCTNCDTKRFAQKKGVERRLIWDLPASSTLPVNRF